MEAIVRQKLWSIGGGKGGIGKSIFTLGLGISLARLGYKIIVVDADLGGANLHTLMGVRYPPHTMEDFLLRRVQRLEDIIIETGVKNIGLICGADDILGSANDVTKAIGMPVLGAIPAGVEAQGAGRTDRKSVV